MKKQEPTWPRKIIHIDMDAFFAAIEQRDYPDYRGKPLIVGGTPEGRGVVATCSYEARKFGIHSAMPAATAKRLCAHAIFVKPRISKYKEESRKIMAILRQHTDLVEPASLDEAYLDITKHKLGIQNPVVVAELIKQNIHAVTGLTASAGVAPNMFLAKIASDLKKPDGLTVIRPHEVADFVRELPVRKIPGVGPVTEKQLLGLNLKTCGDLAAKGPEFLRRRFGKTGGFLFARAQGRDSRVVEPDALSKQYSTEETFARDILDINRLREKLKDYAEEVFGALSRRKRVGKTVVLKVKYHDFELITRSLTLSRYPKNAEDIYRTGLELLLKKTQVGKKAIRLLGLGISNLEDHDKIKEPIERDLFEGMV